MRTSCIAVGLALIMTLTAISSEAAVLPFSGTLSVIGSLIGGTGTVSTTAAGTGTSVGGGTASIPANLFAINQSVVVSPTLSGLAGFAICASGLALGAPIAIPSATAACPNPLMNNALSFTGTTGNGGLNGSEYFVNNAHQNFGEVPLGVVGAGGTSSGNTFGNLNTFTIAGSPWQLGTVTGSGVLNGVTTVLTAVGFDNRNSLGQGTLQLVTSSTINYAGAFAANAPIISVMTLNFVPEPSTALLLGSGIAGLVMLGRRRMKE